jgi:hypothetical protein
MPTNGRSPERRALVEAIQKERGSTVLTWLTGDRPQLETQIAFEQVAVLYDHLIEAGHQKRIDLFMYSRGGLTLAGFAAVNMLREFCDELSILVPYRAQSCATLIALGCDEIVMGRLGQLSPVDPAVNSPYNPPAPSLPGTSQGVTRLLPLSVEDVVAYANLARDEFKLKEEESMIRVLESLASKVHPIALGSVQRSRQQIQMLATKLLALRGKKASDTQVKKIVQVLTRELGSHDYIISRREARDELGLPITLPSADFESTMWKLYKCYDREMELTVPYNQEAVLGTEAQRTITLRRAFIEGPAITHIYETERKVSRIQIQAPGPGGVIIPTPGYQEQLLREGWVEFR